MNKQSNQDKEEEGMNELGAKATRPNGLNGLSLRRRTKMGTKANPAKFDCYANALSDEPMFILLARDATAPTIVKEWAELREQAIESGNKPRSDYAMVVEARDCALAMEAWRRQNKDKWKRPPVPEKDEQ